MFNDHCNEAICVKQGSCHLVIKLTNIRKPGDRLQLPLSNSITIIMIILTPILLQYFYIGNNHFSNDLSVNRLCTLQSGSFLENKHDNFLVQFQCNYPPFSESA